MQTRTKRKGKYNMTQLMLAEHIKKQLLADTALITRTQNHDFVALATQNRNISARFAAQIEKLAVEGVKTQKEFDPMATSFFLEKDRISNNQIIIEESRLMELLLKK